MTALAPLPRTVATHSLIGALLLTLGAAQTGRAQEAAPRWQLRVATGSLVPTGAQRADVKRAPVIAAQLARAVTRSLAVVGTFGWARSRDLATPDATKLDILTADLGLEATAATHQISTVLSFTPIIGVGTGMRHYNHRNLAVDATTTLGGYLAAGGEIGIGRVGLRIEARDYLTNFTPLVAGGRSAVRNDLMLLGALRIKRH